MNTDKKSRRVVQDVVKAHSQRIMATMIDSMDEPESPLKSDSLFGFNAVVKSEGAVLSNSEFDFEFEIPFDDDAVANEATLTFYNLNDNTINRMKKGNAITVEAGYQKDTGVIFEGWISKVKTTFESADKVTTVYALDDVKYTPTMLSETTYEAGTQASYILKDLLGKLGLPIAVFEPKRDHIYDDETKVSGSITEKIKEYSDVCGVSTYIYKQKIYCRSILEGDNLHFAVSPDTGMIGSPEPFEEQSEREEYTDTVYGYTVTMLLQHRIATAGIVEVASRMYKGEYRISSGEHVYDGLSATTKFDCIEKVATTINEDKVGGKKKPEDDYTGSGSGSGGSTNDIAWTKKEVPLGKNNYPKSYMSYRMYTDPTGSGYQYLWGSRSWTNQAGLRMYGNCICCAFGSYYGPDGTFVKVEWTNPNGSKKVIYCVKGDEKKDSETDSKHQYHPMEYGTGSVCEFIVDGNIITSQSEMYDVAQRQLGLELKAYITGIWTSDKDPYPPSSGGGGGSSTSSVGESVMKTAEAEIGTVESPTNMTKYGAELGQNGVAWCGIFVCWCIINGGASRPPFNYASATAFAYAAQYEGWGTYHARGSGYKPRRGDIFVKNYRGSDFESDGHVGFVRYDSDGSTFTTVEGNSSDMVRSQSLYVSNYTFVTPPYMR